MDIAVDLVEIYLRVNGYVTLSEWQVQTLSERGQWESLTDIDILGVRFPGAVYAVAPPTPDHREALLVEDPALFLEPDDIDIIIGEVKEGEVHFNPSIAREETLRTALQRFSWLYEVPLEEVCAEVTKSGLSRAPGKGGAEVRTRLVAFGQAATPSINIIPLGYILERSQIFLDRFDDQIRSAKLSSAAAATLKLMRKSGFELIRTATGESADPQVPGSVDDL